jgi:hypothetical protein
MLFTEFQQAAVNSTHTQNSLHTRIEQYLPCSLSFHYYKNIKDLFMKAVESSGFMYYMLKKLIYPNSQTPFKA